MSFDVMEGLSARVGRRRRQQRMQPEREPIKIVLIRHGKPDVGPSTRLTHRTFEDYIETYERAGLDPGSSPPAWLVELARKAQRVYCSDRPRARESARALAPHAQLEHSPLFMEAQLKSPKLPVVKMKPAAWAVIARLAWHAGHDGGIEDFRDAKGRAEKTVDILSGEARENGLAVLVAHGYFNAIVGRALSKRGWRKHGRHRAKFWNAVVYELSSPGA